MQKQNFAIAVTKQFSGLKVSEEEIKKVLLKTGYDSEHPSRWTDEQIIEFSRQLRSLTKPMIIVGNKIDSQKGKENYERIKTEFKNEIIPCSAESELALREANKQGVIEYIPGDNNFKIKDESSMGE